MNAKKTMARGIAAALYLGLGALAVLTGRKHEVYFNNYAMSSAGSAQAADSASSQATSGAAVVTVEGMKPLRVRANGMRLAIVGSRTYSFTVEYEDGRPAFKGAFRVPFSVDVAVIPVAGLSEGDVVVVAPAAGALAER